MSDTLMTHWCTYNLQWISSVKWMLNSYFQASAFLFSSLLCAHARNRGVSAAANQLIPKIKAFLSLGDLETVSHASVTSLDVGVRLYSLSPAAILSTGKKTDDTSQVLSSFHWLSVKYRIDFKSILSVFRALVCPCSPCRPPLVLWSVTVHSSF